MSKKKRQVYEFDNFRLDAGERQLSRDGEPVTLVSKAFDLLLVLIDNNGRLVEKDELYQRVWGDQVVEESNLTVQMSSIRKALGDRTQNPRYVVTVPGFGYRFVGDVVSTGKDCEFVIETETLSRIVIEKQEADDDNSRQRLPDDDNVKIVKALPPAPPGRQTFAYGLWRWTERVRAGRACGWSGAKSGCGGGRTNTEVGWEDQGDVADGASSRWRAPLVESV